jgi:hypothetical protein
VLAEVLTALVGPFVQTITQEFFRGRRETVELVELREEVVRLASEQGRLAEDAASAQSAFRVLVELLTRGEVFAVREESLSIAPSGTEVGRLELPDYLHGFEIRVESAASKIHEPARRSQRPRGTDRPRVAPPRRRNVPAQELGRSLDAFFDGFDEELRNERLNVRSRGGQDQ